MHRRHPHPCAPPSVWLMTDPRMGEALWTALKRLPRGAGVVFRYYDLAVAERRAMLAAVMRVARRRRLFVLVAAPRRPFVPSNVEGRVPHTRPSTLLGTTVSGFGEHNRHLPRGFHSRSAHSRRDIVAAERAGADLVFVSPVFATRSHPGARALGVARFGLMIRGTRVPLIALGGMTARRGRVLARLGAYGWAGIDAWIEPSGSGAAKPRRRSSL